MVFIAFLQGVQGETGATGAQFYSKGFNDLGKGNGTHRGYGKAVYPDGDVILIVH